MSRERGRTPPNGARRENGPSATSPARIGVACLLVSLVFTAGCEPTQRVVAWYVTRQLDRYVDFTHEQKDAARSRVDATLRELRRTEVPSWVDFLRDVQSAVHVGLTEHSVARLQAVYDARLDASVAKLCPALASILVGLSEAQIDHLVSRLREKVDESYPGRDLPPFERRAKSDERALDALEDLVGHLRDEQKEAVREILRGLPDDHPAEYRAALQQITRLGAFLSGAPTEDRIDAELRSMWAHRDDALGPGRDRATRETEQRRAIVAVDRLLDARQRAHAEQQIAKRIRMLRRFMVEE